MEALEREEGRPMLGIGPDIHLNNKVARHCPVFNP